MPLFVVACLFLHSKFANWITVKIFNGAECWGPRPIDGVVYLDKANGQNPHRVRHIDGHCNNMYKGKVRVRFWVTSSMSRIFIEEVPKSQA